MDVKMNRNMGRVLLATACAAALTVGTAVPAFAVNQSGTTSVTYSSSQQVPGTNGWGFEIPTSIPFGADKSVTVDASVNLYNTTPGGSVWLESANVFMLQKGSADPVGYEIAYTGGGVTTSKFDNATTKTKAAIGTFDKTNPSAAGVAKRTGDAKEGGAHTDTLTFSYEDTTGA